MIKPWIFEFMHGVEGAPDSVKTEQVTGIFNEGMRLWQLIEELGFEGVFFSEHHFSHSYSPSPNLLIAAIAQHTQHLRLGTMGMVLPLYSPWRVVEEVAMLDHLTEGRLEIGCANGVPQELKRIGIDSEEARDRFNESLEILDAALIKPVISHHGKYWNFDDLAILPRPRQQPSPPKWTTVVSKKSAKKTAERNSKICTGFQSVELITEIFDVYRNEADWNQFVAGPDHIGLRRNVSVAEDESEAKEGARVALEATLKLVADDPRVGIDATSIIDNPTGGSGFSLHEDEFISGTPDQVAEQIIVQCRACGAGHFLATIGRASRLRRAKLISMFGKEVVPKLRQADIIQ